MWWIAADQTVYESSVGTPVSLPGSPTSQISFGILLPSNVSYGDEIDFPSNVNIGYRDFLGFEETLSLSLERVGTHDANLYEWKVDAYDSGLGSSVIGTYKIRLSRQDDGTLSLDLFSMSPYGTAPDKAVDGVFNVAVLSGPIGASFEHRDNSISVNGVEKYGPIWNSVSSSLDGQPSGGPALSILTNPFEEQPVTEAGGRYILDVSDQSEIFQIYLNHEKVFSGADRIWPKHIDHALGGTNNDRLVGNADDNFLHGWEGNDILKSSGGNDTLKGGSGNDTLIGGEDGEFLDGGADKDWISGLAGDDLFYGGSGQDTIKAGRGNDSVYGGEHSDFLYGNLGDDYIIGQAGDDKLLGGGGQDTLLGGGGDDYLSGENGADVLFGGLGDDVLVGGTSGNERDSSVDIFVFSPSAEDGGGFDRIRGFEDGLDMIDLSRFGYGDFIDDVLSRATDRPSGLRIDWGEGNVLFIENFGIASFDASDVIL